jgi:hypothetical protein
MSGRNRALMRSGMPALRDAAAGAFGTTVRRFPEGRGTLDAASTARPFLPVRIVVPVDIEIRTDK